MQRLPVESSDIVSIGYESVGRILEVEFQGGRIYQYRDVAPDIYAQFMRADSFGTFFFAHINGRYRYEKLQTDTQQSPGTLAFVSGSQADLHDLQVACELYGIDVEPLALPIDEIQADDAEEIATKKAKQAYKLARQPVVVSTAFWNILALHGFPGAYMTPISKWLSAEELLTLLSDKSDRAVSVTRIAAYYDGKRLKLFKHDYWGNLAEAPRGEGTSIERLMIVQGQDKTLAELHEENTPAWETPEASIWRDFGKWLRLQRLVNPQL